MSHDNSRSLAASSHAAITSVCLSMTFQLVSSPTHSQGSPLLHCSCGSLLVLRQQTATHIQPSVRTAALQNSSRRSSAKWLSRIQLQQSVVYQIINLTYFRLLGSPASTCSTNHCDHSATPVHFAPREIKFASEFLSRIADVLQDGLGLCTHPNAWLELVKDVQPVFRAKRSVLYATSRSLIRSWLGS